MFKRKKNKSMRAMVKSYATILIVVISTFSIIISSFIVKQAQHDAVVLVNDTTNAIINELEYYKTEVRRVSFDFFSTPKETEDLNYYFLNTYADYAWKNIVGDYINFPKKVHNLYFDLKGLEAVTINLLRTQDTYVSKVLNTFGILVPAIPEFEDTIAFNQTLINHSSFELLGYLTFHIDKEIIHNKISNIDKKLRPGIMITNSLGNIVYQSNELQSLDEETEQTAENIEAVKKKISEGSYTTDLQMTDDYTVFSYISKNAIRSQAFSIYWPIILATFFLDALLLYVLYRTFGIYSDQVEDIIDRLSEVREGDYNFRINLEDKGSELYSISNGINEMLNSITEYVETIYQLEIKQRDITLMALQSQINPHFLYNTLEFIRMYAVSEGVDELAEIVFSFSELLRNNISLERETTLESEIEFTENYIYLYQMRYPNRLAYKVSIEEDLKHIMLPKFTLQPLIENYIKHGVDFGRIDNAIFIVVYRSGDIIHIEIQDNGRGTNEKNLELIRKRLDRNQIDIKSSTSIGLYNVHERLKAYFKSAYSINIASQKNEGFRIEIEIDVSENKLKYQKNS